MTSIERYRLQFESLTPNRKPPVKPLTGIEKQNVESEESRKMWIELQKFNQ
jgi:hypothetical protein